MAKWKDIKEDKRFAKVIKKADLIKIKAGDRLAALMWEEINSFMHTHDKEIAKMLDMHRDAREDVVAEVMARIHNAERDRLMWAGYTLPRAREYDDHPEDYND